MGDFAQVEVIPDEKKLSENPSTEKSKKKGGMMKWMKLQKKGRNLPASDESVENNSVFITINSTETGGEDTCAVKSTVEEFTGSQVVESTSYTTSADNATSRHQPQDKVSLMQGLLTCCQIEIADVVLPTSAAVSVGMLEEEDNSLVEGANNEESKEEGVEIEIEIIEGVSK
eukprot:CAMPEP_0201704710 /NCGR_PEP_ID=MMETSP0578-20130828/43695_1 /ASSEMBLY_ACC=CAM_ASM_000663 /TAXON_ID=267565 /ORGANISM="Skeletonema grethea, Strain CCMP 1804" /LENGTH=171 /DNA_ID=CAMNT_0048192799 /DNA_START=219 /DNA_END=734 /DNA_ORIENTATION=+